MTDDTIARVRANTLMECAKWHERQIARYKREIAKSEALSRANNDGNPRLGGEFFATDVPRFLLAHRRSAAYFRRAARRAIGK